MSISQLLRRAREYTYDRENLPDFLAELEEASAEGRQAVGEYLLEHDLMIARLRTKNRKPGPWFWLDRSYLPAICATLSDNARSLEVMGRAPIGTAEKLQEAFEHNP